MNTANIKAYAPQARVDFIAAIEKQAAKYGIEIYCVDTPYVIGGKTVLIDPLIIGGL